MGNSGCKALYYKENDDDSDDECLPIPVPCDVKKYRLTTDGSCRPIPEKGCPLNQYKASSMGSCKNIPKICGLNQYRKKINGKCIDLPKTCSPGKYMKDGNCIDIPVNCSEGEFIDKQGNCIQIPKLNPIDLVSNKRGKEIIDSLDKIIKCTPHSIVNPKKEVNGNIKNGDRSLPIGGGWCSNNYNYFLPTGMLPKCRGGKAQRVCYEPGNGEDDYFLSIKGETEKGGCEATSWLPNNSSDKIGYLSNDCKKVIELINTDKDILPDKIDGRSIGGVCLEGTDCHSGDCDSSKNRCLRGTIKTGKSCIHDDQCASPNKCIDKKCNPPLEKGTENFSNKSENMIVYGQTQPMDTLILVFVILMVLFLLFRICKRLKVMK